MNNEKTLPEAIRDAGRKLVQAHQLHTEAEAACERLKEAWEVYSAARRASGDAWTAYRNARHETDQVFARTAGDLRPLPNDEDSELLRLIEFECRNLIDE